MEATLTIGEVARRAGLKTSAIRYYESVGVLPTPERQSGQRRYSEQTVRRLHVIEVAKRAGFSLDEARLLLSTADDGSPAFAAIRELAARKLPEVDALISRAVAMRAWLQTATACNCTTLDSCALLELTHRSGEGAPDVTPAAAPRAEAGAEHHARGQRRRVAALGATAGRARSAPLTPPAAGSSLRCAPAGTARPRALRPGRSSSAGAA